MEGPWNLLDQDLPNVLRPSIFPEYTLLDIITELPIFWSCFLFISLSSASVYILFDINAPMCG